MNIYLQSDYRSILKGLIAERKREDPTISYQSMAEAMGTPKSYLSKVMHGRANINVDQMFLAAKFFRLNVEEQEYLELLLAFERTNIAELRDRFKDRIEMIRSKKQDTASHLDAETENGEFGSGIETYYLDPIHQLLHAAFDIPELQSSLKLISERSGIHLSRIQDAAKNLEALKILERHGENIVVKRRSVHLPKNSSLYDAWRTQLRLLSMQRVQSLPKDEHYGFSVVFTAAHKSKEEIKDRFFEFLKSLESTVSNSPSERVYQLNFDLLPWT